jgi:soluble lytic murein transglycosylase-like protein
MLSKLTPVTIQPEPRASLRSPRTLEQEKARLRKATNEFEAFFKYQMLKTMRQTIPEDPSSDNLPLGNDGGKETFTDMFDMEIARSGAGGKRSLSEILYNSMEKLVEARYAEQQRKSSQNTVMEYASPRPVIPALKRIAIPKQPKPIQIIFKPEPVKLPAKPLETSAAPANLKGIAAYQRHIDAAAAETSLDSALIASVIHAESGGNPKAVSPAGAKGLMQLVDSTAQKYGVVDSFDPAENIRAGSRFLKHLLEKYKDVKLALAAYNAGPGNVDRFGGIPPFKETRAYVAKVTSLMKNVQTKQATVVPKVP